MSVSHHGDEKSELAQRLLDQFDGKAKRQYSAGRMGADDDGDLAFKIAVDDRQRAIFIDFGKPVVWIGLTVDDAKNMIDQLSERVLYLTTGGKREADAVRSKDVNVD